MNLKDIFCQSIPVAVVVASIIDPPSPLMDSYKPILNHCEAGLKRDGSIPFVKAKGEAMSYEVAKSIVSGIEQLVIHEKSLELKLFDGLKRETIYPIKLLFKGCKIWYRDFAKFSLLSFLMLIFVTWFSIQLSKGGGAALVPLILPLVILVPMVLSMFSIPTTYSFCGVKHEYIELVVHILRKTKVRNNEQLSPIKSNIDAFENRVKTRIISLRMFMALCWTGFIYMYSEFTKIIIETKKLPTPDDVVPLSLILLSVLFLYISVESYSKANILIFRSAQLGCNEYEFIISGIDNSEDSSNQHRNADSSVDAPPPVR
jgi:hypothetical protein